jgi:hypothetical protein
MPGQWFTEEINSYLVTGFIFYVRIDDLKPVTSKLKKVFPEII